MKLPEHDLNVLPALWEMYSKAPTVVDMDSWHLAQELYEGGYLNYLPSLSTVGAAQDVLLIERGDGERVRHRVFHERPVYPTLLMKGS